MNDTQKLSPQTSESELLKWRNRNSYYYKWLEHLFKFVVRPGSRVLEVGCGCGDLLAAVEPAYGVGIDADPAAIGLAKKRFPNLKFIAADPHELQLNEKFDYILICNSIGRWRDIQQVFERLRPLTEPHTRIVITYYNYLWEGIMQLGSRLKMRRPQSYDNWLPTDDIANLLTLTDFDVIRTDSYLLMPKRIPILDIIFNRILALLPLIRKLNLVELVIARPMPEPKRDEDLSVSVIVPCRNERGNIADAVNRIPQMGRGTEIIFVDGNSTDGTAD